MNLTVCGSFGFGNAGDEAVPLAVADMLEELGMDIRIDILGRYDQPDLPAVIGLGKSYALQRQAIKNQPMMLAGGGIIEAAEHSTIKRCAPFFRGQLNAKVAFIGVSADAGVRYKWLDRLRFTQWMRETGTVYARDVLSAETIKRNFLTVRVETVGDLVLWMKPSACTSILPNLPSRYISVILAPRWKEQAWLQWISSELVKLARDLNAALVFIPMSIMHDDDRSEHSRVADYIRKANPEADVVEIVNSLGPREVAAIVGRSLCTISMRLHGCVMAYAQRTPFVALAYHPKLSGFVQTVGATSAILPSLLPAMQSADAYGYRFTDLELSPGALSECALRSINEISFVALDDLKKSSLAALNNFLFL